MIINALSVLLFFWHCCSLCMTVTGTTQFRKTGGVEKAGIICNYVTCYKR